MEIKIGIADTGRELVIASDTAPEEIASTVSATLADEQGILDLLDEQGRRYLVPCRRIGYVEIGQADGRRVGFGL